MSALIHPDQHDAQHETTDASSKSSVRLHITPFTPELYQTLISGKSREFVSGVSFHQIKTFPESAYGYISLPDKEAQRLKRLNGAVFKGKKLHIAIARPEKWRLVDNMDTVTGENHRRSSKRQRAKSSRRENVISGFELPKDRHIKRGWAVPATNGNRPNTGKRKANLTSSEAVDTSEILFRASFPSNKLPIKPKNDEADKKRKRPTGKITVGKSNNRRKLQSRLPITDKGMVSQYIDGQGWVDGDQELVEAHIKKQRTEESSISPTQDPTIGSAGDTNDAGQSSVSSKESIMSLNETSPVQASRLSNGDVVKEETPSHSSIPPVNENTLIGRRSSLATKNFDKVQRQRQVSFALCEEDQTAKAYATANEVSMIEAEKEVHPLEKIFKPSKSIDKGPILAPIQTSFSFFDGNNEDDKQTHESLQTPFTIQDRRRRQIRSPAPTPDTAAIPRKASWPWAENMTKAGENKKPGTAPLDGHREKGENGDENDDEDENEEVKASSLPEQKDEEAVNHVKKVKSESDFAKWFWENRGENNRAWRRRRREAMKTERQRQNKRLAKHA